jgi:hypothetical protein
MPKTTAAYNRALRRVTGGNVNSDLAVAHAIREPRHPEPEQSCARFMFEYLGGDSTRCGLIVGDYIAGSPSGPEAARPPVLALDVKVDVVKVVGTITLVISHTAHRARNLT